MAHTTQDFTTVLKDMMGAFPVDTKAMEETFKNQTTLAEKMSAVAIDAAGKSAELSVKWTHDTLSKVETVSKSKAEPADYAQAMSDFASASAEAAAEHMSAFADIAKKMQSQTLELMIAAGKDISGDMTATRKKTTRSAK